MKESAARIDRIKSLKNEIEATKQEYYRKCNKMISIYNKLDSKLNEVSEEIALSEKCSIYYTGKVPLRELLLYSFRISGTTSAPFNWNYTEPLPSSFRPPAPQEHEIRATKLFETEKLEKTVKPTINLSKLEDHIHISILSCPGSFVRYTIDGSLPSDLTGRIYQQPFLVPADAEFIIKAVAFMEGKKESDVVCTSVQGGGLALPSKIEHIAERSVHITTSKNPLDLGLEISPYNSSRYSSDDDNEYASPFTSFGR